MDEGYAPEAIVNYLCLLGWSPKENREKVPIKEVMELFDLPQILRHNARFDIDKLNWLNGEYVRAALQTCKGKINTFDELPAYCGFYFTDDFDYNPQGVAKHFTAENRPRLKAAREAFSALEKFDADNIELTLKRTASKLGVKVGAIVHSTRLAVTGSNVGPSLYHLLEVLGKQKVLTRIDRALATFGR